MKMWKTLTICIKLIMCHTPQLANPKVDTIIYLCVVVKNNK